MISFREGFEEGFRILYGTSVPLYFYKWGLIIGLVLGILALTGFIYVLRGLK